jgi:protein-tyrosine phosphatase
MAQGLLREMLASRGKDDVCVISAGTAAMSGEGAARFAREVALAEDGIDLSGHRAQPLSRELLETADLVLAMALTHAQRIEAMDDRFAPKTYLLTSFPSGERREPEDIEDPMGGSQDVYRKVYRCIKEELERIMPALTGKREKDR